MPSQRRHRACIGDVDTALQQLEAGHAALVQRRDLAIDDGGLSLDVMRQDRQLRILPIDHIPVARNHPDLAVLDVADGADAVPLHFVDPDIVLRRIASADLREHRRADLGKGRLLLCRLLRGLLLQSLSDLLLRAPGQNADGVIFRVPSGLRGGIFLFEQKPFIPLAALHADQCELSGHFFAVDAKLEVAARKLFVRRSVTEQLIRAPIPQHDAARRRSCPWESRLRSFRTRWDDPRPSSPDAFPPDRASDPWERPRI